MAIDTYASASKVSVTPSMLEVITKKCWRITGTDDTGKWSSSNGLIHLCTADINPNSPAKPTIAPCSLLSLRGYAHFYKVFPNGFTQNTNGRPDNYEDYFNMLGPETSDTAFKCETFSSDEESRHYHFNWLPDSYTKTTEWDYDASHSWISGAVTSDGEVITVTTEENTTEETRTGYISFYYDSAKSTGDSARTFAVYVTQYGGSSEPSIPFIYPNFDAYVDSYTPINEDNSGTNPYIISNPGNHIFYIGGNQELTSLTANDTLNGDPGLTYETEIYDTADSTGAVGHIKIVVELNTSASVLSFEMTTATNSKTIHIAFQD